MIEAFSGLLTPKTPLDGPPLHTLGRAFVDCGCSVYIGHLADSGQPAGVAVPCCDEHMGLIWFYSELMAAREPDDRPMVAIADEVLTQASEAWAT